MLRIWQVLEDHQSQLMQFWLRPALVRIYSRTWIQLCHRGKHLSLSTCTSDFFTHGYTGTNEIVVDVDDDGVISLIFECSDLKEDSQFVWSKNYEAFTDTSRLTIQTAGGKYVEF